MELSTNKHYFYILICKDNTLYCGYSNDLNNRVNVHNSGKGAKYTRSRIPVKLVYFETFDTKSKALKRECEVKKLNRNQKLKLISEFNLKHRTLL